MTLTALVLFRCIHFTAATLLWGGACLYLGEPARTGIDRVARVLSWLNLLGALGWFFAECATAGDGLQDALHVDFLKAMLTDTRFGLVWGPHLVVALTLALCSITPRGIALLALAGLNLGSIGLTGHAILPAGGVGYVHQALSVLHLLSGAYWIGALPLVLAQLRAPVDTRLLLRFSAAGHWAVATVIMTGVAKTLLIQFSRGSFDPGPVWSVLLAVKVLSVLAMTGLALHNRYRLVPQGAVGLAALRRGTLGEIALSAGVLVLISILATLSPFGQDV
jgi:putative copper resistance protein D